MKKGCVYITHHVDTEGPLYEAREELHKRLKHTFNIYLPETDETLAKLGRKEIPLQGKEDEVARFLDPHTIGFLGDWGLVDKMLNQVMSKAFREALPDTFGGSWIFNWHCMDHVGFIENPRRRDLGYFKIFDFYKNKISETKSLQDRIHWHFHPIGFDRKAHIPATSYINSFQELCSIINHRLIDRNWFPVVNRAGFHTERPDSHWFLEQWIPFDPSNQSVDDDDHPKHQLDLSQGRYGDWRFAPKDWSIYSPSHDDYQKPGECRRKIARVLNMKSRHRNITAAEIKKAFLRAQSGERVYLGITNHDWRDMAVEINEFRSLLKNVIKEFPDVPFQWSEAVQAFRNILYPETDVQKDKIELQARIVQAGGTRLVVDITQGKLFGPQPWLAMKTKDGRYFCDNFDILVPGKRFGYALDEYTMMASDIAAMAVASNDQYGNQSIVQVELTQAGVSS